MTMKVHLDKLTQEQQNGVKLAVNEAAERKALLLKDAQAEIAGQLLVAQLLITALQGIPKYIRTEHEASSKCMEIINSMRHKDVAQE